MAFRLIDYIRRGYAQVHKQTEKQHIERVYLTQEIFKYMMRGGHLTSDKASDLWGTHSLTSRISDIRRAMAKKDSEYIIRDKVIDKRGHKEYWIEKK